MSRVSDLKEEKMRGSYFSSHNVRQLPILAFVTSVPSIKGKFCCRGRSNIEDTTAKHTMTSLTLMEMCAIKIFWFPLFWARIWVRKSKLLGNVWLQENEWVWIFACRLLRLRFRENISLICKGATCFSSVFLKPRLIIKNRIIEWNKE